MFSGDISERFCEEGILPGSERNGYHRLYKGSDLEIGRFCMLFYEEAVQLALVEDKEIILIGNYGSNGALNSYMSREMNESEFHFYQENEAGAAGAPGTDSNENRTDHYYYSNDSFSEDTAVGASGGIEPIPAPEEVEAYIMVLSYQEGKNYNAVDVEDETTYLIEDELPGEETHDFLPDEQIFTGEEERVYLPNEQITEVYLLSEQPCYLYIPADYTEAEPETREELLEMNQLLIELTNFVTVLYVSREAMEDALITFVANRTAYVGDNVSVSHIVGALPAASGLSYQFLELGTITEPYEATIHYRRQADNRIDADIPFLDAVLMFA